MPSTVGTCYFEKEITVDKKLCHIALWDTAGQERYSSLTRCYYRGAQAAIVVFDLTQPDTLDRAKKWIKELQENTGEGTIITLVGNKADIEKREISEYVFFSYYIKKEIKNYVKATGILYMESSAKMNQGIKDLFVGILQNLIKNEAGPRISSIVSPEVFFTKYRTL